MTDTDKYYEECTHCNTVMEKLPCCGILVCPAQDIPKHGVCDCEEGEKNE